MPPQMHRQPRTRKRTRTTCLGQPRRVSSFPAQSKPSRDWKLQQRSAEGTGGRGRRKAVQVLRVECSAEVEAVAVDASRPPARAGRVDAPRRQRVARAGGLRGPPRDSHSARVPQPNRVDCWFACPRRQARPPALESAAGLAVPGSARLSSDAPKKWNWTMGSSHTPPAPCVVTSSITITTPHPPPSIRAGAMRAGSAMPARAANGASCGGNSFGNS